VDQEVYILVHKVKNILDKMIKVYHEGNMVLGRNDEDQMDDVDQMEVEGRMDDVVRMEVEGRTDDVGQTEVEG
jgi:hypothetical protein